MKARSGAMQSVFTIIGGSLSPWEPVGNVSWIMAAMLVAVLVASIAALGLTLFFGKLFARIYNRIPYRKLTWAILILLWVLIFIFTGLIGIAVAVVATLLGLIPPMIGVKRVHLMGSLVLPIILFFSGLDVLVLGVLGLA